MFSFCFLYCLYLYTCRVNNEPVDLEKRNLDFNTNFIMHYFKSHMSDLTAARKGEIQKEMVQLGYLKHDPFWYSKVETAVDMAISKPEKFIDF